MSLDNEETGNDLPVPNELETLKARATQMGVQFHPAIGLEKLREKVNAAVAAEGPVAPAASAAPDDTKAAAPVAPVEETPGQRNKRLKLEQTRLVRIRITCMNPNKKDIDGEILTVGNSVVGTIRKYVPFNAEEGWHVPYFMYEVLRDRECQIFVTERTKNGVQVRRGKQIKEFAIEVMPDLTEEELHDLAQRQAMAKSID